MQDNSMNELTTPTSGNLTAAQQDAYRLDYEIKAEAKNIVSGICRIGKCLKEMNERNLYKELGYTDSSTGEKVFFTSLEEYAERTVGLKGRAAYNGNTFGQNNASYGFIAAESHFTHSCHGHTVLFGLHNKVFILASADAHKSVRF